MGALNAMVLPSIVAGVFIGGMVLIVLLDLFRRRPFKPVLNRPLERMPFERRRQTRWSNEPIHVLIATESEPPQKMDAWIMDLSRTGLGLQTPAPIEPGNFLVLSTIHAGGGNVGLRLVVNRCESLEDAHWSVGCGFTETPSIGTLLLLGCQEVD